MLECTSCLSVCSLIYFQTFPSLLCFIKDSLLCFIKDYIMQSLSSLPPGYVWLIGGTIEDEGRWKEEARVFPPCSLSAPRGIFGNNCNSSFHDPCHRPPPHQHPVPPSIQKVFLRAPPPLCISLCPRDGSDFLVLFIAGLAPHSCLLIPSITCIKYPV